MIKLTESELRILELLRTDSRISLTEISRKTDIPVSTVFRMVKKLENDVIHKHTTLIELNNLNNPLRVLFTIKPVNFVEMKEFLHSLPATNSLSAIDENEKLLCEIICKDMADLEMLEEKMHDIGVRSIRKNHIVKDVKRERLFTSSGV